MTGRQATLWRYGVAAVVLTLVITVAVVWLERSRNGAADDGIVDVLARDLPADAPVNHFTDVTARAGVTMRHFGATRSRVLPEDMGSGLAWGDCDSDGFEDLYVVNFVAPVDTPLAALAALPGNALYRNRGDGTFEDVSVASGAGLRAFGMGASWGDYDGDGDEDLYVTNYGRNALLRNDGACSFTDVSDDAGVAGDDSFSGGAVWGDYDGDGDLDLYVTNYVAFDAARQPPQAGAAMQYGRVVPFTLNPASYAPVANWLFRNDGDGRFTDVAGAAGVANAAGRSLSAAWADWDADGDVDLYVANDISDNAFFLNRGDGSFEDISTISLTADYRGAMGLAVGDYDRDADLDFFVTHWIAQENALYENHMSADAANEPLLFTDVADLVGLGATGLDYVGWGTGFIDFDNDGRQDVLVVNGHTLEDDADPTRLLPQHMQLFWNRGEEGFFELSEVAGPPFERLLVGRGAAVADYDRDGDVDIAVLARGSGVVLMNNAGTPGAHWIEVDLRQQGGNPRAIGATIRIDTDEWSQIATVGGVASYMSQHARTVHFGLGEQDRVARVVVRWPGGAEETFTGLAADRRYELVRGGGAEPLAGPVAGASEEDFWAAYRAGNAALRDGDRAAAIDAYERALAIQPAHPDTLHNLAQLRYARGEVDVAWDLLERLAAADPRGNRAFQQLSRVAGTPVPGWSTDLAAADAMIDRALQINPGNSESHLLKARWAAYRGDRGTAAREVEAALGLNRRGAESYALAIWLAVGEGDDGAAERLRQDAVAAMCGAEEPGRACLGDALHATLSAYWTDDGTPRRGRSDNVGRPDAAADAAGWTAPVDLDGDDDADLLAVGYGRSQQVRLAAPGDPGRPLPADVARAWSRRHGEAAGDHTGPRPMPWRGVFLDDQYGRALVLAGAGVEPVRVYVPGADVWRQRPVEGLPQKLSGGVIAAADWNGDGAADLFLANVDADAGGRIFWRRGADRFEQDAQPFDGPLSAAAALDADGDGAVDLVTAAALPAHETAVARLLQSIETEGPAEPAPVLALWRNEDGRLRRDADAMPALRVLVQDLAVVGAAGDSAPPDLWVATGGLDPERIAGDLLLANHDGRFVDISDVLADALRWRRTVRAWPQPSGDLLLLRGGVTRGDAAMFVTVPLRRVR